MLLHYTPLDNCFSSILMSAARNPQTTKQQLVCEILSFVEPEVESLAIWFLPTWKVMAALEDNDFPGGGHTASMLLYAPDRSSQSNLLLRSFEFPQGKNILSWAQVSLVNAYDRAFPLHSVTKLPIH